MKNTQRVINNISLIRLVDYKTVFTPFAVCICLGFRSVATNEMAELFKIFHFKTTVRADYCIFIVMTMSKLIIKLLPLTIS